MSNTEERNDEEIEIETPDAEPLEADEQESNNPDEEGEQHEQDGEQDSVIVTIGDEKPPEEEDASKAPSWVRDLRKKNREDQRRIRELEEQLQAVKGGPETKPATLGPKPTLEGHDYDADKYEAALAQWYEQKRIVDEREAKAKEAQEQADKAWQQKLADYSTAKAALKVRDYDDAETVAQEHLSKVQQGIIVQGAENPALVIYAIGKNPAKAKELAGITDPVKYAFAVAKLETQLKVTQKKSPPPPERTVSGTGRAGAVDSTLDRLRAEAEKTGDYTKVARYRQQQKQKQRA